MHPQQKSRTRSRSPNRKQPDKATPMRPYHIPRRNNRNQEPGSPNRRSRQNQRAPRRPSPKPRSRSTHTQPGPHKDQTGHIPATHQEEQPVDRRVVTPPELPEGRGVQ